MTASVGARFYRFGPFVVDAERRLLFREGSVVPLTSKTFDILLALLDGRDGLITKRDLLARVWPNQFVEEGNLTVHISALRKALGERRGEHLYVVTVPGHGYRFVANVHEGKEEPVAEVEPPASVAPTRRQHRTATRVGLGALVVGALAVSALVRNGRARVVDRPASVPAGMTTRLLTSRGDISIAVVSHEGREFVYVEFKEGLESLWLGHTGGDPPVLLRPPADMDYDGLAFTPDDSQILFSSRGVLSEMPSHGGAARALRSHVGAGFSLSPDGNRMAFVREGEHKASTLVVADVHGGAQDRDVAVLAPPRRFSESGASWSPDGLRLAIGITSPDMPTQSVLASVRVEDGAIAILDTHHWDVIGKTAWLSGASGIVFHATGTSSDYHLWHLDLASHALRCITPDLSRYGRLSVSVSDDGRTLLTVRGEITSSVWVAPANALARARAITSRSFGKLDGSSGIAFAPDGRIVYVSFVNGSYAIWTMGADGRDPRPLTTPGFMDRFPQVTFDGRVVVFASNRGGGADIWRVDIDGTHLRRITSSGDDGEPALTPNGRSVLFTHRGGASPSSVWSISIDGGVPSRIGPPRSSWPRVSPDGRFLAHALSDSGNAAHVTSLGVVSIADRRPVAKFDIAPWGTTNNGIHWSPDGTALVYRKFSGGLWWQPIAGGAPTRMLDLPDERIYFFDWSRDGRTFAFSYGDEVRDVVQMNGFR